MVEKVDDCIFCKVIRGQLPSTKVGESENFIAILDTGPVCEGHTLIIPKKHYENILAMPSVLGDEMISLAKDLASKQLKEGFEAFNLVMNTGAKAGQVVMHTHLHLIPRKADDGIRFVVNINDLKKENKE